EWVSPGTATMRRELMPTQPEQVEPGGEAETTTTPSAAVISLYPGATRSQLVGLLALVSLFAVGRNNLSSPDCMRRLAVVVVINGTGLALFGLLQFFTSSPQMLYWSVPSLGAVFGPFINRNHFATYANLCIGLGIGLFLHGQQAQGGRVGGMQTLLRPQVLSTGLALALMVAAVAVCLSRGGLLALAAGGVVWRVFACWRARRPARVWGAILVGAGAAALVAWLAFPAVAARVGTLWRGAALEDGRLMLWTRVLPLWRDFPVWGSGYGTFT